ncbi:MAG TPA: aminotransferase class I/II-fold pyridoxal phosphate-dependent enzyme [Vicinamibacteria bacterium]|nr:aminotransferase class I/II-fold pyridoxal phosphate-dependent enzyme [Vicinamibacteria bacterium]
MHGRHEARPGPLATPIVQTSTFAFGSAAEMRRHLEGDEELFLYTRYANPTVRELEESLAAVEDAEAALALSSGMAAMTTAVASLVRAGDEVLASASLYGGTVRLLTDLLPRFGVTARFVGVPDLARVERVAGERSRVLIVESPTNPGLEIVDLAAVCASAHARGLVVIADNTFATPLLQRPLALGADLVMHSLTKALAGHSDVIGGALAGSRARIDAARATMKVLGGCMDPHAAFLVLRGVKTLHLRVERQCDNALALARRLEGHAGVTRVLYPGLPSHPGHEVARRQMSAFGGVVTLVLAGGLPAAERFYDRLRLVARAASLGGVESLASLPVHTSHYGLPEDKLREAGIDPGMVRLSLGVEDAADVIADVERALGAD